MRIYYNVPVVDGGVAIYDRAKARRALLYFHHNIIIILYYVGNKCVF